MKAIGEGSTKKPPVITIYKGKKAVKKIMKHSSEGEIMKLLKGKENIAEIYDIEDHTLYMKLYNLNSLRDLIDNDEVYVQLDKYDIAYQIQNGLKQIHKLGYVHSDLKSSNILCEIRRNKILLVLDEINSLMSDALLSIEPSFTKMHSIALCS